MTIIIFLVVLSVLIIAPELGHFLVAKWAGIRADEFGLGYPPRAKKLFTWKGTDFTLNWLPFGGFVKIFGEDESADLSPGSFASKNRGWQALVLVAGVSANFLLAWLLLSIGFVTGLPASATADLPVTGAQTVITEVLPDSPASRAGLLDGDAILGLTPEQVIGAVSNAQGPITLHILRGKETLVKTLTPEQNQDLGRLSIGAVLDSVGTVRLSPPRAVYEGLKQTWRLTALTVVGLYDFLKNIFIGRADFSQVTGPVGLAGLVGNAEAHGLGYLLSFTALISLNLALLNLLPIPALDGGRLLFVIIEAIRRRPVSPKLFNLANNLGFGLLLLLMAIVTVRDVIHLL